MEMDFNFEDSFKRPQKGLVYFTIHGKFRKFYDIVAVDYYVVGRTMILYTVEGHRFIINNAEDIKVSEDIVFNCHWRET